VSSASFDARRRLSWDAVRRFPPPVYILEGSIDAAFPTGWGTDEEGRLTQVTVRAADITVTTAFHQPADDMLVTALLLAAQSASLVEQSDGSVLVDGAATRCRVLSSDGAWAATFAVADRWVTVRGPGPFPEDLSVTAYVAPDPLPPAAPRRVFWEDDDPDAVVEAFDGPIYALGGRWRGQGRLSSWAGPVEDRASVELRHGDRDEPHVLIATERDGPASSQQLLARTVMGAPIDFPVVPSESETFVLFGGQALACPIVSVRPDWWAGTIAIGDRWVVLRGRGVRPDDLEIVVYQPPE
jgi:hypothetical protein